MRNDRAITAIRTLSREDVDQRLSELEAERRALKMIRRSLAARDRARHRHAVQQTGAADA